MCEVVERGGRGARIPGWGGVSGMRRLESEGMAEAAAAGEAVLQAVQGQGRVL